MDAKKTAKHRIVPEETGNRYEFFCDLSNALVCTTSPIKCEDAQEELMIAWESEGRKHFNRCQKCGKWIIDAMYNPDVLTCVGCTPIEEYPDYCPECGAKTNDTGYFCHMCGTRLLYGGEKRDEKTKHR